MVAQVVLVALCIMQAACHVTVYRTYPRIASSLKPGGQVAEFREYIARCRVGVTQRLSARRKLPPLTVGMYLHPVSIAKDVTVLIELQLYRYHEDVGHAMHLTQLAAIICQGPHPSCVLLCVAPRPSQSASMDRNDCGAVVTSTMASSAISASATATDVLGFCCARRRRRTMPVPTAGSFCRRR
jgi:hypothetical protein